LVLLDVLRINGTALAHDGTVTVLRAPGRASESSEGTYLYVLLFWTFSQSLQDLPTNPFYCTFGLVPNVHLR
jgi:hypothetical protein